ncbi:MAG: hypothetical protein JW923_03860 [Spirochaetales bacterium]|nr:hypothetical protein [Spirochaetales bacterium]
MKKTIVCVAISLLMAVSAWSWDDHDQLTLAALSGHEAVGGSVLAEDLSAFLEDTAAELAEFLDTLEERMASSLPAYPRRPDNLALDPALRAEDLVLSFMRAIRVNPDRPFVLFIQPPANGYRDPALEDLPLETVDVFKGRFPNQPFQALSAGQSVPALTVVATASDEPDYGMDLGLWDDNGTAYGARYAFGPQPFGNPALIYGSQAPFHMTFPREDPIITAAAPFVGRGLAHYRVTLYTELARFAFAHDHDYWGWRFAGWAIHYLEDMAMPYHARLMPGKGTLGMLTLYGLGTQADIDGAVVLLSNRHMLLEDFQYRLTSNLAGNPALATALAEGSQRPVAWRDFFAYDVAAAAAYKRGPAIDRLIVKAFPERYSSDPSYDFGADPDKPLYDSLAAARSAQPDAAASLETSLVDIMRDVGDYVRAYVDYVSDPDAVLGARRAPLDLRLPAYGLFLAAVLALLVILVAAGVRGVRRAMATGRGK